MKLIKLIELLGRVVKLSLFVLISYLKHKDRNPVPPTPSPNPPPAPAPPIQPVEPEYPEFALDLLAEHNAVRKTKPLVLNQALMKAAQEHSKWMANSGRMDHIGNGGSTHISRALSAGYGSSLVWENIAQGYTSTKSVMNGWLSSSGHANNIFNKQIQDVGFGKYVDSRGVIWWTAVFGKRS